MKRKMILLTVLVLLATLAAVPAGAVSGVRCEMDRNGHTIVSWSGGSDCEVRWSTSDWGSKYTYRSGCSSPADIVGMVPGETYDVTVTDGSDSQTVTYTVPKTTFTDFKKGKKVELDIREFDARNESIYRTFQLRMHYPRLGKERRHSWQLALRTPKGYTGLVKYNDNFRMEPRYSYYYWDFDLSEWMNDLEFYFDGIPQGDYVFEVYLDGKYYGEAGFYVYN